MTELIAAAVAPEPLPAQAPEGTAPQAEHGFDEALAEVEHETDEQASHDAAARDAAADEGAEDDAAQGEAAEREPAAAPADEAPATPTSEQTPGQAAEDAFEEIESDTLPRAVAPATPGEAAGDDTIGSDSQRPAGPAGTEVQTPAAEVQTPTAEVQTPTAEVQTPTAEVQTPTAEAQTPAAEVQTPTAEAQTPAAEVQTPTAEAQTPATEVRGADGAAASSRAPGAPGAGDAAGGSEPPDATSTARSAQDGGLGSRADSGAGDARERVLARDAQADQGGAAQRPQAETAPEISAPPRAAPTLDAPPATGAAGAATTDLASGTARAGETGRAVPELPARTEAEILHSVRILVRDDGGQARIRLEPPQLGQLQLRLTVTERVAQLSVVADRAAVAELLARHLPELRQALETQGIQLDRLDVNVRDDGARGFGGPDAERDEAGSFDANDEPTNEGSGDDPLSGIDLPRLGGPLESLGAIDVRV